MDEHVVPRLRPRNESEGHLRSLEPLSLWPANSLFVEGYLTTRGEAVEATYRMIREAGFVVDGNALVAEADTAGSEFRLRDAEVGILRPDVARRG